MVGRTATFTPNGIRIHHYHAPSPGKPVIVMCHGVTDNGLCFANLRPGETSEILSDIYMLDAREVTACLIPTPPPTTATSPQC